MSEQILDLKTEWTKIRDGFLKHFERVQAEGDKLIYDRGSEYFRLRKTGEAEAGMPLHSFKTDDAESIKFEESKFTLYLDETSYVFRR